MRDRIETRLLGRAQAENDTRLKVFDATFTEEAFRGEMKDHGFEVVTMKPIIKHYFWQAKLSHRLANRAPRLANWAVRLAEWLPSKQPLEWIATCRKI